MAARIDLRFDPEREQAELMQYLGEDFELERLWHYQAQLDAELAACADEATFYRTSAGYLYNLTAFAMTGTKLPYLEELVRVLPPGSRLLDYGCGIGSDGLMLLEAGYRVEFADFDNPSAEYLRWRLDRRGLSAAVHDLGAGVPGGYDGAYAFDVIEHVPDPLAFLAAMESRAALVVVNFLAPGCDEQALHHELPLGPLLAHVARHPLIRYRLLHGRSHLILYRSAPGTLRDKVSARARIAAHRSLAALAPPRHHARRALRRR